MLLFSLIFFFFFSSRRRHTRSKRDWSSDVCSSDLIVKHAARRVEHLVLILCEIIGLRVVPEHVLARSEEHTSELQSRFDLVCRLLLEKKKIARGSRIRTSTGSRRSDASAMSGLADL